MIKPGATQGNVVATLAVARYSATLVVARYSVLNSKKRKDHNMELGLVGLGRMGANMGKRLLRAGHTCVGYARHASTVQTRLKEGAISSGASSLEDLVKQLSTPRAIWLMVPAASVDATLHDLVPHLSSDDIAIDGRNSYYHDDLRRTAEPNPRGIPSLAAGSSCGVWGLERGYCLL